MITKITIQNTASYGEDTVQLDELSKFNYFYGANGSGKTTISRIIQNISNFTDCELHWANSIQLHPLVYNKDFVEANFNHVDGIKGVFTLGNDTIETYNKIQALEGEKGKLIERLRKYKICLEGDDGSGGKNQDLLSLETRFTDKCWDQKRKHDVAFKGALEGYRSSAEKFKSYVLENWFHNNVPIGAYEELQVKCLSIFRDTLTPEIVIPNINFDHINDQNESEILTKRVIGKSDVDIAKLIEKLNSSDWVKEGLKYYDDQERICPFCQQHTTEALSKSLSEYFDTTYQKDINEIGKLYDDYSSLSTSVIREINNLTENPSQFLVVEKLKNSLSILELKLSSNLKLIEEKKTEPSRSITLAPLDVIQSEIASIINETNAKINEHNQLISNIKTERLSTTQKVWKYIVAEELKDIIKDYLKEKDTLGKGISGLNGKITETESNIETKSKEIQALTKQTISIQPTIDEINGILQNFGFSGFKLDKTETGDFYKIIRSDNTDAKTTLSEGEISFVTFLYFYCVIKGSLSDADFAGDRIVVFDDPVSSLDNDVLFVVSSLIRQVINDVKRANCNIKQVFVLTHNVYFYKQVSFCKKSDRISCNDITYWIVKRTASGSIVKKYPKNPIKSSYQLLWAEYSHNENNSQILPNVMRRILESYFTLLGDIDFDLICNKFDGTRKPICESLFAWLHAGSHNVFDDAFYTVNDDGIALYKDVFKLIFINEGHEAHYNMMMCEPVDNELAE